MPKPAIEVHESVAAYLTRHLDASPLSAKAIAAKAGFGAPNILSMIKSGATKLPFGRIVALADAIGADPKTLFRLCVQEYLPELWVPMAELFWGQRPPAQRLPVDDFLSLRAGQALVLSGEEAALIVALRAAAVTPRQAGAIMAALHAYIDACGAA